MLSLLPFLWEKVSPKATDEGCCVERGAAEKSAGKLPHRRSSRNRHTPSSTPSIESAFWNTPHPSRRCAPIHLLPQGEKGELGISLAANLERRNPAERQCGASRSPTVPKPGKGEG